MGRRYQLASALAVMASGAVLVTERRMVRESPWGRFL
jgi:hypothetical protein